MNIANESFIKWIRKDLDDLINDARIALEDFADGSGNEALMARCTTMLHQIHGTLQMVQLYGAAMLAEEMEVLAQALHDGQINKVDEAASALMMAMVQLPDYLDKVEDGEPDSPMAIISTLNELRAARNTSLFTELSLFGLDLEHHFNDEEIRGEPNGELPDIARRLRPKLHRAMLKWFRGLEPMEGVRQICEVVDELSEHAGTDRVRQLFRASGALASSVAQGSLETGSAIKLLIGKIDREVKRIIDTGEQALIKDTPLDLFKNLLYYVAQSDSDDERVVSTREQFHLGSLRFGQENEELQVGGLNRELLKSVSGAVNEDLTKIKDELDLYIRTGGGNVARLESIREPLNKLADTLGMLGQGSSRMQLKEQAENIEHWMETDTAPTERELMEVASTILSVETGLQELTLGEKRVSKDGRPKGLDPAYKQLLVATLREASVDMAHIKESITNFIANPSDLGLLKNTGNRFKTVQGALNILQLNEPATMLSKVANYVEDRLACGVAPDSGEIEALADVISSVEYFMESVADDLGQRDDILEYTRGALSRLKNDEERPMEVATLTSEETDESLTAIDESLVTVDEIDVKAPQFDATTEALEEDLSEAVPALDEANDIEPIKKSYVPEVVPEVSVDEEDEPDSDILEIFMEEANEELEVIQKLVPAWVSDQNNQEALERFRRSFHTLKGSGRLVGAETVGEFAWSIENLLNRIIDGTVEVQGDVLNLMRDVLKVLPALIESEAQKEPPEVDYNSVMARAFALAEGRALPTVDEDGRESETEPVGLAELSFDLDIEEPDTGLQQEQDQLKNEVEVMPLPMLEEEIDLQGFDEEGSSWDDVDNLPSGAEELKDDETLETEVTVEPAAEPAPIELDDTLKEIFDTESQGHLQTLRDYMAENQEPELGCVLNNQVTRALHTLHGSANMAGVTPIAKITKANERYFDGLMEHHHLAYEDDIRLLNTTVDITEAVLQAINVSGAELPEWESHADEIQAKLTQLEATVAANEENEADTTEFSLLDSSGLIADTEPDPSTFDQEWPNIGTPEEIQEQPPDDLEEGLQLAEVPELEALDSFEIALQETEETIPELIESVEEDQTEGLEDAGGISLETIPELEEPVDDSDLDFDTTDFSDVEISAPVEEISDDDELEPVEDLDEELIEIFLEEAQELSESLETAVQAWQQDPHNKAHLGQLQRILHTMKGASRLSGVTQMGDLSHSFESLLIAIDHGSVEADEGALSLAREVSDHLMTQVDSLGGQGAIPSSRRLVAKIEAFQRGESDWQDAVAETGAKDEKKPVQAEQRDSRGHGTSTEQVKEPISREQHNASSVSSEPSPGLPVENRSIEAAKPASTGADSGPKLRVVKNQPIERAESTLKVTDADSVMIEPDENSSIILVSGQPIEGRRSTDVKPTPTQKGRSKQEQIRVRSDQLDRMVNHAGEISIYRTRIEQQNGEIGFNLGELDQTVIRLKQQLRIMEIETEAQMLFRFDREKEDGVAPVTVEQGAEFDPLEMDRFSTIQQMSRSLAETVNDIDSIREMIEELNRESETLLLQQSRITNDLQDGLLRTRMVSFENAVPRLQRLVRQTANSLGKKVDLKVVGAGGDLDRTILDRIVAPLEHILRNAISHGIETPKQRLALGKPAAGQIRLILMREGRDVVIHIADDGAGVNTEAVRKRAVERGLMTADADIADDDLVQFLLEPGFSTAQTVTQISGRGVGMDVVSSEVKQLGGILDMDTRPGVGTNFKIRLPFTLAISEALLVSVSEEVFAIPYSSIEGITRVSRKELEACYWGDQTGIDYAGTHYRVRYLGELLEYVQAGSDYLTEQGKWFPCLLVRHGEHRVAIQVDQMVGSRQIVVKSVGLQLSTVRWITGGTILGDGRVALILDVSALVRLSDIHQKRADSLERAKLAGGGMTAAATPSAEDRSITVMVVDDSITVRKVTSRLLNRHNMEVVTAKDGVDALAQLQEVIPDVMLLDIEMPRMDGYELTRHMRHTQEYKKVPIIMITSRSGEKHRQRAIDLGVNSYLGKPYQEAELLDNIYALLAESA